MIFFTKEPMYVKDTKGVQYAIPTRLGGFEKSGVVYFYDNTKSVAVGFSKDFCMSNPDMFIRQVESHDREIQVRDAIQVVLSKDLDISEDVREELVNRLKIV